MKVITRAEIDLNSVEHLIDLALDEDIKHGDLTTENIISGEKKISAIIKAKAEGIISGLFVAEIVFKKLDNNIAWNQKYEDGDIVKNGDILVEFSGSHRAILMGERTALNFLQRMSGVATKTNAFVHAVKGTNAQILDTRKTLPAYRMLDKYSVTMGGGKNHRIGLFDIVMIKDNHIRVAEGISNAVNKIRAVVDKKIKIEVETSNITEVEEAINCKVDIIMLDNMSNNEMKKAVDFIAGRALVEASGNVNLERVKSIAETGVDFISIGALTHSVFALDIGQYILD
ncbi:MAG: carboxylating nicotinate-nucleotide diphosphorylase [Bacteroidetes bacterium]|nr:carboxylating nicotinate-nucleotide diphosphorylase [Bacteroidota bacterium]MBU1115606.1 carboxylating nicotinate-nucleotide diphosphorylase [Bacteroidota bacterium]MBU1797075.1 carboxylating nicotinate-nucleotide diphosphorylase [Bacteroidota bacterium]